MLSLIDKLNVMFHSMVTGGQKDEYTQLIHHSVTQGN